jgi:hypothetical protein
VPTAKANLQAIQELHATLVKEKKVPNFVIKAVEEEETQAGLNLLMLARPYPRSPYESD